MRFSSTSMMRLPQLISCTMLAQQGPSRQATMSLLGGGPPEPLTLAAMEFLDASPDPFHATAYLSRRLEEAGFAELEERDPWSGSVKPGGKYYYVRDRSCLVAFSVGGAYEPGNGFKVLGAHTDSPNLKLKPRSKLGSKHGKANCLQLDVQCYGGGLWHTWFDRDLSISGRVFLREGDGTVVQRLVKIKQPVLRVPNLAIHLQSADEREAFKVNKEDHLQPIVADSLLAYDLAKAAADALGGSEAADAGAEGGDDAKPKEDTERPDATKPWEKAQEPVLLRLLAAELGVEVETIADFELNLYDTQAAAVGGAHGEYLYASRLDNLASCFTATEALVSHATSHLDADTEVSLVALFDHEEVGSESATGAGSPVMGDAVRRISTALSAGVGHEDLYAAALRRSFVFSVDMAHAVHPNYEAKHEKGHGPKMNQGIVIKSNANQRYASTGLTSFIVREIARRAELPPPQEFVVRNDCPCGSTIGPIISAGTGMRAVDLGMPQLSMHSVREMQGVHDLGAAIKLFEGFLRHFRDIDEQVGA
tara:strand:+ start:200 stop:1807 length:1608 start_codon:yes stop_codon:yes gene_type:complete